MLAIEKGGEASGKSIKNNLMDVANPPGTQIYDPVEGINKLRNGEEIDFYGSGGMQNFNEVGDVTAKFALWHVNSEGNAVFDQRIPLPQELTPD